MMWNEFEEIAGYEVSYDDYTNILEPMYNATELSKQEFVKVIDRRRFDLKYRKRQMVKEMKRIAQGIWDGCGLRTYSEEEGELTKLAKKYAADFHRIDWVNDIETYVFFNRRYAYCGVPQDRGCSCPVELVIGRGDTDYERIALVAQ